MLAGSRVSNTVEPAKGRTWERGCLAGELGRRLLIVPARRRRSQGYANDSCVGLLFMLADQQGENGSEEHEDQGLDEAYE